ncbi:MAG TPA: hypothetical protein VME67_26405 [Mycobacterium sp.]|nr:hypothetical protein [Mycobacterium sp.]HTX98049.1 hypothetical protein [Mycobacterium sp.]
MSSDNPAFSTYMNMVSIMAVCFEKMLVSAVREAMPHITDTAVADEAEAFLRREARYVSERPAVIPRPTHSVHLALAQPAVKTKSTLETTMRSGTHHARRWRACNGETCLPGVVATDLDTEHGGTDANKRDGARRLGRLNVDDLQL